MGSKAEIFRAVAAGGIGIGTLIFGNACNETLPEPLPRAVFTQEQKDQAAQDRLIDATRLASVMIKAVIRPEVIAEMRPMMPMNLASEKVSPGVLGPATTVLWETRELGSHKEVSKQTTVKTTVARTGDRIRGAIQFSLPQRSVTLPMLTPGELQTSAEKTLNLEGIKLAPLYGHKNIYTWSIHGKIPFGNLGDIQVIVGQRQMTLTFPEIDAPLKKAA